VVPQRDVDVVAVVDNRVVSKQLGQRLAFYIRGWR
jgi:hypothetical protein